MDFQADEQLNKLINDFNSHEILSDHDNENEMRQSIADLDDFAEKLKVQSKTKKQSESKTDKMVKTTSTNTSPIADFDPVSVFEIPELPQHLRVQFQMENIQQRIHRIEQPNLKKIELLEKIVQPNDPKVDNLKYEENALKGLSAEARYREICAKNKALNVILQKEKLKTVQAREKLEKLTTSKINFEQSNSGERPHEIQMNCELEKKYKLLEDRILVTSSKIASLESENAIYNDVFRQEILNFQNVDECLKHESGLKARAQQLELLKSKLKDLRQTKINSSETSSKQSNNNKK